MKLQRGLLWPVLFLVIFVMPVAPVFSQGFPTLGGYSEVSVNDPGVVAAAYFAVAAQSTHMNITLVSILGASQQVVAGINYSLRLKVKVDQAEKEVVAVIFQKLSGILELTSWVWR